MSTWDTVKVNQKLKTSNAWVARAAYRLAHEMNSIDAAVRPAEFHVDLLYFISLKDFFAANGFFTDRHIELARKKMRAPYVDYLAMISNENT